MDTITQVRKIFDDYLTEKRHRKTPERFTILEEIYSRNDHFDVESLYLHLRSRSHSVSRATVYNTIDLLLGCELIVKHQFGENHSLFEKAYGYKQHDHLICAECNKVFEFCDPRLAEIQNTIGKILRFEITHHSLNLYGHCMRTSCEFKSTAAAV